MSLNSTAIKLTSSVIYSLLSSCEEEEQTIIHCNYVSKKKYINGGWVNIYPTTYLVSEQESITLLHAENIPLAPQVHVFNKAGELKRFSLIFPAVPKSWTSFDLIEKSNSVNGFKVHNIKRNNAGIYKINIG